MATSTTPARREFDFAVGDVLTASTHAKAQGFTPGTRYEVRDLSALRTPFGDFVTYYMAPEGSPADAPLNPAGNAHLLFDLAEAPSALDRSVDTLRRIADRDRATDSPVPAAVDAVFAELERLRAREARLVAALESLRDASVPQPWETLRCSTFIAAVHQTARAALTGKESSNG